MSAQKCKLRPFLLGFLHFGFSSPRLSLRSGKTISLEPSGAIPNCIDVRPGEA